MNKLLLVCVVLITGCASGLQANKFGTIDSDEKDIVIMNSTVWDSKIRIELMKQGFKVKRFSSVERVHVSDGNIGKSFNSAEARYGITVIPGPTVDRCLSASIYKYKDISIEVTDLQTNEVVFITSKGGWPEDCGVYSGNIFPELITEMKLNWN
ncbi:hypothetical protein [Vibrio breoganii]|uniref:hypothetical protein n=1 Tax=Vibrio breoganii TaxID=553239 RepID=UPI000C8504A8|nr:hypothetical protein [Vibrio breoganii]PMK20453.1 hypothetical protein BCU06_06690 [Vibrio breoganii]